MKKIQVLGIFVNALAIAGCMAMLFLSFKMGEFAPSPQENKTTIEKIESMNEPQKLRLLSKQLHELHIDSLKLLDNQMSAFKSVVGGAVAVTVLNVILFFSVARRKSEN